MSIEWPETTRVGHLVVMAAPHEMTATQVIYSPIVEADVLDEISEPVRIIAETAVGTDVADVVEVPQTSLSAFGGHLVLVWHHDGHTYAIGYHGTDEAARLLGEQMAGHLDMVQP
jgi:hypothetical protein